MVDQQTDAERLTALEQTVIWLTGRLDALETRNQKAAPLSSSDTSYLVTKLAGAVEGSQQADSLEHFQ